MEFFRFKRSIPLPFSTLDVVDCPQALARSFKLAADWLLRKAPISTISAFDAADAEDADAEDAMRQDNAPERSRRAAFLLFHF